MRGRRSRLRSGLYLDPELIRNWSVPGFCLAILGGVHPTLLSRLRDRDYRLTSQRRVVAQVLEGPNVHMTADEVHHAAIEILPEISRATVYSTLNELTQMGELLEPASWIATARQNAPYAP